MNIIRKQGDMEIEDVDKKHRLLEKIRSDEERNMIKEKFLKY